jgi:hypothetical protein
MNILTLKKHDPVIIIKCRHFEYWITRLDFDLGDKINGNKKMGLRGRNVFPDL